jgi:hypothetical protein
MGGHGSTGLYIDRAAFKGASYDDKYEKLTIWLGPVAISVEPRDYDGPHNTVRAVDVD